MKAVCNHDEHQNPWISEEGWIVTGEEAWTQDEWEQHARRAEYNTSSFRRKRDARKARERYYRRKDAA